MSDNWTDDLITLQTHRSRSIDASTNHGTTLIDQPALRPTPQIAQRATTATKLLHQYDSVVKLEPSRGNGCNSATAL